MILRDQESYSTQVWIGIGLFGAVMILAGLLTPRLRAARDPMGKDNISYNYEMPRVETEDMPFDLSDREVSRKMRELEALAKKKYEALKTADPKKALAAEAAAAKVAAANKAKAMAAARQKAMSVRVTEASDRYKMKTGLSETSNGGGASSPNFAQVVAGYFTGGTKSTSGGGAKESTTEEEELEMTSEQWRALLVADPSADNIAKFLKSRAAGKVAETTVVEVVRDLLKDSADDRHKAAMVLISSGSSALMFEFLVKEKVDFGQALQSELQVYQDAYSSPANLIYLGPILASATEPVVLNAAMEQITLAVTNYKKVQNGNISLGIGTAPTLNQLQIFLATLKNVGANEDTGVAQLAQTLTADIQGLQSNANVASASLRRRNQVASENE